MAEKIWRGGTGIGIVAKIRCPINLSMTLGYSSFFLSHFVLNRRRPMTKFPVVFQAS